MGAVGKPVAVLGGAGATENAVEQVGVAGTKAAGLFGADHTAKQALIFEENRYRLGRRRGLGWLLTARLGWTLSRGLDALLGDGLPPQHRPVEADVRMRVLQRFARLIVKGPAAESDV